MKRKKARQGDLNASLYFNKSALKSENARIGDKGPDSICGSEKKVRKGKGTFEILNSLEKQDESLSQIICF